MRNYRAFLLLCTFLAIAAHEPCAQSFQDDSYTPFTVDNPGYNPYGPQLTPQSQSSGDKGQGKLLTREQIPTSMWEEKDMQDGTRNVMSTFVKIGIGFALAGLCVVMYIMNSTKA